MASMHVVSAGGSRASGGAALGVLLGDLPGGKPPAALARRFCRAADVAYRLVADRRGQLSRLVPAALSRRADHFVEDRLRGSSPPA